MEFSEYLQWNRMAGGPVFLAPPCITLERPGMHAVQHSRLYNTRGAVQRWKTVQQRLYDMTVLLVYCRCNRPMSFVVSSERFVIRLGDSIALANDCAVYTGKDLLTLRGPIRFSWSVRYWGVGLVLVSGHIFGCGNYSQQKIAPFWTHRPQFARWRSSAFSRSSIPKASFWLQETANRKTQSYLAIRAIEADLKPLDLKPPPLVCVEVGNQSGDLEISGGHGNAQEEYAARRRIKNKWNMLMTNNDQRPPRNDIIINEIVNSWSSIFVLPSTNTTHFTLVFHTL